MAAKVRVEAGQPAGGQFTATSHTESAVTLPNAPPADPELTTLSGMPVIGVDPGYKNAFNEEGQLTVQVRLVDRKPDDAPDGTAAIVQDTPGGPERSFTPRVSCTTVPGIPPLSGRCSRTARSATPGVS